jgi:thioredoxin-like negative regulator of GroEL
MTLPKSEVSMIDGPSHSRWALVKCCPFVMAVALLAAACDRTGGSSEVASKASATTAEGRMSEGLKLLNSNPSAAADTFREILKENPTHYGARFQLAKALDLAGRPSEARPIWIEVLGAAVSINDTPTAGTARARLARPDTLSQNGLMNQGLDLLYKKSDPAGAADRFRQVLARNPTHYGATFQLAKSLDQAGKPGEARPYWQKMVTMADAIRDKSTGDVARARLQKTR